MHIGYIQLFYDIGIPVSYDGGIAYVVGRLIQIGDQPIKNTPSTCIT